MSFKTYGFTSSVTILLSIATLFLLVTGDCPEPGHVDDMELKNGTEATTFAEGTVVIYKCDESSVEKSGSGKSVCHAGDWSHPTLECQLLSCGPPSEIDHGKAVGSQYKIGNTVTYECFSGYVLWSEDGSQRLKEKPELICHADLTWTGELPKCLPIKCPELEPEPNSEITDINTGYSGRAVYACKQGFIHMNGNLERSCQLNETWSGTPPVCQDASCEDPETDEFKRKNPNVDHCRVTQGLEVGSTASCYCKTNKEVIIKCLDSSSWEVPCAGPKPETKPTDGDTSTGSGDVVLSTAEVPSEDTGLPSKIIAAIVFSIMAVVIIVIVSLVFIHKRRKKNSSNKPSIRKAASSDVQNGIEMKSLNQKEDAV